MHEPPLVETPPTFWEAPGHFVNLITIIHGPTGDSNIVR